MRYFVPLDLTKVACTKCFLSHKKYVSVRSSQLSIPRLYYVCNSRMNNNTIIFECYDLYHYTLGCQEGFCKSKNSQNLIDITRQFFLIRVDTLFSCLVSFFFFIISSILVNGITAPFGNDNTPTTHIIIYYDARKGK